MHHARRYFPRCLAEENITCDVDENLWPGTKQQTSLILFLDT
jgi:hypothetical protein